MGKRLELLDKIELAKKFGLEIPVLEAVIEVESAGSGFDPKTGNLKIQFESHIFERITGKKVENRVDVQLKEWEAYDAAKLINWEAALLSTSWGLGQIMGFNYKLAGFASVAEMVNEFRKGEREQLLGMLNFIASNHKMMNALRDKDWATFAKYYNGPQFKKFKYDTRLATAYAKHLKK